MPETIPVDPVRRRALFLVFAASACALLFNLQWPRVYRAKPKQYIDVATDLEARLRVLRSDLPKSGYVIYLTDRESRSLHIYPLAPLAVTGELGFGEAPPPEKAGYLVLDQLPPVSIAVPPGFVLMKDYGNGVQLYRRDAAGAQP